MDKIRDRLAEILASRKLKFLVIIATYQAALILTWVLVLFADPTLWELGWGILLGLIVFPSGFLGFLFSTWPQLRAMWKALSEAIGGYGFDENGLLTMLLVWLIYIGLAVSFVRSNSRRVSTIIYSIFVVLLIMNVAGCVASFSW